MVNFLLKTLIFLAATLLVGAVSGRDTAGWHAHALVASGSAGVERVLPSENGDQPEGHLPKPSSESSSDADGLDADAEEAAVRLGPTALMHRSCQAETWLCFGERPPLERPPLPLDRPPRA